MRDVHDFGPFYSWAGRYEGERFIQRGIVRNLDEPRSRSQDFWP